MIEEVGFWVVNEGGKVAKRLASIEEILRGEDDGRDTDGERLGGNVRQ